VSTVSAGPGSVAPARRSQLFRLKPVDVIVAQREEQGGHGLRRSMSLLQLTALSIGATLGTGIFVILGEAVPLAGPVSGRCPR
jgi:basic amino acid/polyamine antiporter, APA family